ncbi:MAG TPA: choice-of-anchor L domain-containing protein, partial [Actinomycetota bacterium]|nr:choice-of-anchor L domain-containing protein [Actinomycetota bacterium]
MKRFPTSLGALALFAATVLVGVPAQAAITTSSTAQDIAIALNGTGASVTGTFTAKPPSGAPSAVADTALASFPTHGPSYAILSTGNAAHATSLPSVNASTSNGGGNVRGNSDFDVTVLKVDLSAEAVGANTCLRIDFRFLSEEFPEYVGSAYNDAFIAELDSSNWTTSGSSISAPNNFAFDPDGDPITINSTGVTNMTAAEANGTVYDGATPALVAQTSIAPNAPHSVYLSIFDDGDDVFDSAVFLDNLTLGTETGGQCPEGAKPNLALSLTTDLDGSTTPGVTNVALNQIPPTEIDQQGSPTQDAPIGKSPIGKSPIGKSPIGKSPIGKSPIGKSPIGKSAVSAFPLLRPGGWQQVLANSCDYQTAVPQAVSFAQLLSDRCATDGLPDTFPEFSPGSTDPLTMDQIN